MSKRREKEEPDQDGKLDAQMLAAMNWFPDSVEIQNWGANGSGFAALDMITPVHALIEKEAALDPETQSERDKKLVRETRLQTFELLLRELNGGANSVDIVALGLNVAVWMWDLQIPPYGNMTQEQIAKLVAQGRAAICERHKRKVQAPKEAAGQKGTHNPRQKRKGIIEVYQRGATGNKNRALACAKGKLKVDFRRKGIE
jgi:hypothetical protein